MIDTQLDMQRVGGQLAKKKGADTFSGLPPVPIVPVMRAVSPATCRLSKRQHGKSV
jgi:hypothetical protein